MSAVGGFLEAWRCRGAGIRRGGIVMARSTLQACFRRYLPKAAWGNYTRELEAVTDIAGSGWRAVAVGVRDFGNEWAHPERDTAPPKAAVVVEAFRRMDEVLKFAAAMERVDHLRPALDAPPADDDTTGDS
jgi:hypothetical protein